MRLRCASLFLLHSIQLMCSALQQLTDGVRVFLHYVCHGVAKRANGVGKACKRRCLVLPRICRDARGEIEREDPGRIVLAVSHDDRVNHLKAFHEFFSAVGHVCFAPPIWAAVLLTFSALRSSQRPAYRSYALI